MERESARIKVCLWVPGGIVDIVGEVEVLGAVEREFGCRRGN